MEQSRRECSSSTNILTVRSVLLSQSFTVYSADGISVTSFGREKTYGWEDCRMYEISPSVLGDRLSVSDRVAQIALQ